MKYCPRFYNHLYLGDYTGGMSFCPWIQPEYACIGNLNYDTVEDAVHSESANLLRVSMDDQTFWYCSSELCPFLQNNTLEEMSFEEYERKKCVSSTPEEIALSSFFNRFPSARISSSVFFMAHSKWPADITESVIPAGKVYLSPIVDCFDGLLVSWRTGTSPDSTLVNTMSDDAVSQLSPEEKPIIHSDRGIHYRWTGWIERMEEAGLTRSMSKKGCPWGRWDYV